jgi:hypothetical protein
MIFNSQPRHLINWEKTLLVGALRQTYTAAELLTEVGLPRSSYFNRVRKGRVDVRLPWGQNRSSGSMR